MEISEANKYLCLAREKNQSLPTDKLPDIEIYLVNRRITLMTIPSIIQKIHKSCIKKSKIIVASYNVHSFNFSMQIPWFYNFQQAADIARCDGSGIIKALEYLGLNLPQEYRAPGTYLMPQLIEYSAQHNLSLFLLGSKPEYLQQAIVKIRSQYPGLAITGHHGYFNKEDSEQNKEIVQKINLAKPNILLVGMGMPIQENWIRLHNHQLEVNAILPCGAVIDRLAGFVSNCPVLLSNFGLEWLYRLLREPNRLASRYLLGNPAFAFQVALAQNFHRDSLKVKYIRDQEING